MTAELIQGSEAWLLARLGKVTASRIGDLMAKTQKGHGASRANYMAELISQRLTGALQEGYSNAAMQWGVEHEPEAVAAYEFLCSQETVAVGLVPHPRIADAAASPDRLVGDDGLLEVKCPQTATHIDTLLGNEVDRRYVLQMQWQMACTGRKWCDFVSYDPRMPAAMRLFVARVERDDKLIAEVEGEVEKFLRELADKVAALTQKYEPMREAA